MKTQLRTEQTGLLPASLPPAASEFDLSELEAALKSHRCSLGQQLSSFLIKTVKHRCASLPLNPPDAGLAAATLPRRPSRCRLPAGGSCARRRWHCQAAG